MGEIKVELNGMTYRAEYDVSSNLVTVYGESGYESTQIDGARAEQMARHLLLNLIRKGHVSPDTPPLAP